MFEKVAEVGRYCGHTSAGLVGKTSGKFFPLCQGRQSGNALNPDKKLTELGMDSLVAVELKQTLEREYDIVVILVYWVFSMFAYLSSTNWIVWKWHILNRCQDFQ